MTRTKLILLILVALALPMLLAATYTHEFANQLDSSTKALLTVDYDHHEIHEGGRFHAVVNNTIGAAAEVSIGITTPNTLKWAHVVPHYRCSGEANVKIIENPSSYAGSTALTAWNRNRNSANATTLTVANTPTWAGGSAIVLDHIGNGTTLGGGGTGERLEWVLKQNEQTVFVLTSEAASNDCTLMLDWYEHTANTDTYKPF